MDLFQAPVQNTLFDQVEYLGTPEVRKEESVSREARMAALGDIGAGDGLVSQLQALTAQYQQQIDENGDDAIRIEAATRQQTAELEALGQLATQSVGFDPTGEIVKGAAAASRAALVEDIEKRKAYALEQQTIERIQNLAAAGDRTQAQLLINNLEMDPEDRIRDINTRRLIMQREVERAGIAKEDQSWFLDATDFVASAFVPIQGNLSKQNLVDVPKHLKKWYDGLFAGERSQNERSAIYDVPLSDFARFVREDLIPAVNENSTLFGYHNKTEELELLQGLTQSPTALETNFSAAFDNVGMLIGTPIAKGIPLTGLLMRMGARKEAQNLMTQAALQMGVEGTEKAALKTGVAADEVIRGLTPGAVNVEGSLTAVSAGANANAGLERGRKLLDGLLSMTSTERLTAAELETAKDALEARVAKEVNSPIKDVHYEQVKLADGSNVNKATIVLGKTEEDGFATKRAAQKHANSLGYGKSAEVIRDESGQYFVKITENVPEYGYTTNLENVKASNFLSRRILNANMLSDKLLADMAQVSGNKKAHLLKTMGDTLQEPFRKLNKDNRIVLSQILAIGENEGKWFDPSQLNTLVRRGYGRDMTDAELKAYYTAKDINDIEFTLRNDETYKNLLIKGFETVDFDTGIGVVAKSNAKISRDLVGADMGRVFDVSGKRHITERLSDVELKQMEAQGYILVTTKDPVDLSDFTTVKQFLVKGNDVNISPLVREQLAYRAGGHRMYQGKYFVKQTVKGFQPDTGREYLKSPNTYIVAETPAEASFWADRMERARQVAIEASKNAGKTGTTKAQQAFQKSAATRIDEIFDGHAGFDTGEDFLKKMENGTYDKNHAFVVKYDREMPDEYVGRNTAIDNFVDVDETPYDGWLRTQGRMYYSRKGEALKDWQGSMAPTLDPFKTIDRALNNIANIASFSDYKISAMERWVKTYGKYLDLREIDPSNLNHFTDSAFFKSTNSRIRQAGEAQREIIKRNLGFKSELDLEAEQYQRNIAEWISGTDPTSVQSKAFKVATNWWDERDPVSGLRGMAFDMKMGFFNVAQLPMQIQTAFAATMLSPEMGMKGFGIYRHLRYFLTKSGTENALDTMVQRNVHGLGGFSDPQEFKAMMRSAKQSGFFNVDKNHNLVGQYGPNSVAGSRLMASDGAVRTTGRFFFNEGEIANRAVAWRIGWDEAKKALPNADVMGAEFQRYVAGRAEKYSFSMSEQSAAWWQKGALSIPTQFWAYNVRMMEALMGGEFTRAQRVRLMLGQSLLYGSAGLPVVSFISEKTKEHNIDNIDVNESTLKSFYGMVDRGLFDTALYYATGGDVDALVGKRYGTGNWLPETIKDLMGASSYGDKSFVDVMTGATAGIMGTTAKGLSDVVRYAAAESGADIEGMPLTRDALLKMSANVSTIGNGLKAYMVFKYGTMMSNKGGTMAADLPAAQAFAAALSLQPGQQDQLSTMFEHKRKRKEAIDDAVKVITNYRTRMLNEYDNKAELEQQINIFVKLLPDEIRKDVLRKAHKTTDPSTFDGMARQIEKERVQSKMIEEAESGITN